MKSAVLKLSQSRGRKGEKRIVWEDGPENRSTVESSGGIVTGYFVARKQLWFAAKAGGRNKKIVKAGKKELLSL